MLWHYWSAVCGGGLALAIRVHPAVPLADIYRPAANKLTRSRQEAWLLLAPPHWVLHKLLLLLLHMLLLL